jgi:hypothetical protein
MCPRKRLRADPDTPIETALAGELDTIWRDSLRNSVEASLRMVAGKP